MSQSLALLSFRRLGALALVVLLAALPVAAHGAARATASRPLDWPVFDYNAARAGYNPADHSFSPANVGALRRRWVATFNDIADSTSILLYVQMPRGGTRALLFQTTKSGTTYAVDAHNGAIVWRFVTHGPKITTSTPVADPSGRYIYAPAVDGQVHKLVAATGAEVRGGGFPLRITRMPDVEKDAAALNLANGYLYAATSGYIGDQGAYDGHVVALRLRDGATQIFNSLCGNIRHLLLDKSYDRNSAYSCPDVESGIWARAGVVVDPDPSMAGRVYFTTGNGHFTANRGGTDYGDSVLALSADGTRLLGSFTPANYDQLDSQDLDLGSTAPVLLPREAHSRTPLMAVQGGKDGIIRLLNRARLGGVGGEMQDLRVPGAILFSAPAVWRQPGGGTWVYLGEGSNVTALRLTTGTQGVSRLAIAWTAQVGGTSPVIVNGVVFVSGSGALSALDARTGRVLWSSTQTSADGSIGDIHWESPIAVNGWVYSSDQSGHLTAYALPGH